MDVLYNSPGRLISILHRYSQRFIAKELDPLNIGCGQYAFLACLYVNDGLSQEKMADTLGFDKGTTARAVSNLVKQGYLRREVNPDDQRIYKIFLTEKALEVKPYIDQVLLNLKDIMLASFTEGEREDAMKILDKMAANVVSYFQSGN